MKTLIIIISAFIAVFVTTKLNMRNRRSSCPCCGSDDTDSVQGEYFCNFCGWVWTREELRERRKLRSRWEDYNPHKYID